MMWARLDLPWLDVVALARSLLLALSFDVFSVGQPFFAEYYGEATLDYDQQFGGHFGQF